MDGKMITDETNMADGFVEAAKRAAEEAHREKTGLNQVRTGTATLAGSPEYRCLNAIDEKIGWHLNRINELRDLKSAVQRMGWMPPEIHHYIARSMYP